MDRHEWYEGEEREKMTPVLVRLSELDPSAVPKTLGKETSYRRGYFQGFFFAIEMLKSGKSVREVERFLYGTLHDWRYEKHNGKMTQPPGQVWTNK